MKLKDWLSALGTFTSIIAFLNQPLPVQLQLSLDLHESGKWIAALLCVVAAAVSIASCKALRGAGFSALGLAGWAFVAGVLSFLAAQGYIYLVDTVVTPGAIWDRIQTGIWSLMFALAAACFVFVVQAIAAATGGGENAEEEEEAEDDAGEQDVGKAPQRHARND